MNGTRVKESIVRVLKKFSMGLQGAWTWKYKPDFRGDGDKTYFPVYSIMCESRRYKYFKIPTREGIHRYFAASSIFTDTPYFIMVSYTVFLLFVCFSSIK